MRKRIGPYHITDILGHGHSAAVYLGRHTSTNEEVAIKLLHLFTPEEKVQETFRQEVEILQRLSHPNIIQVIEIDFDEANPYFTMSYASKGTLRDWHPSGSCLSIEDVNFYLQQIAQAIQHAHERGVIHCDLKPENILIANDMRLLLSDFGIARIIQSTQSQSTQGPGGTLTYMAPEQFDGKPRPASDQYALAILAYELLCGAPPFQANDMLTALNLHHLTPPPSLVTKNPAVTSEIEKVLFRALEKKPTNRFPTILAFAEAFHEAMHQQASEHFSSLRKSGEEGRFDEEKTKRTTKKEKSHPVKLFVGGLSYSSTKYALGAIFEPFGTVEEVRIIFDKFTNRPKGFAFVTMLNKGQAQAAINNLNGTSFKDRLISVNEARLREDRGPRQFSAVT